MHVPRIMAIRSIVLIATLLLLLTACGSRSPAEPGGGDGGGPTCAGAKTIDLLHSLANEKDVDLLFVIDNSAGTAELQSRVAKSLPKLIEAMKSPALNNKIPNLHIGVVSTDLGAGNYALPGCEVSGGDGGKLLYKPQIAGCIPPSKPYVEYIEGVTNINNPAVTDPIAKVTKALQCIIELGVGGCGFEAPLEAARRALDPKLNRNPGFLRKDARLAVVFVTNEDDCSAAKTQLFDPAQSKLTDPLGPLSSFRCFEFGVQCSCSGGPCTRTTTGPRQACKPAYDWLQDYEGYVTFFSSLKPSGRLMLFAIAGPTDLVEVSVQNGMPALKPSCQSTMGKGHPALRLEAVMRGRGQDRQPGLLQPGPGQQLQQARAGERLQRGLQPRAAPHRADHLAADRRGPGDLPHRAAAHRGLRPGLRQGRCRGRRDRLQGLLPGARRVHGQRVLRIWRAPSNPALHGAALHRGRRGLQLAELPLLAAGAEPKLCGGRAPIVWRWLARWAGSPAAGAPTAFHVRWPPTPGAAAAWRACRSVFDVRADGVRGPEKAPHFQSIWPLAAARAPLGRAGIVELG